MAVSGKGDGIAVQLDRYVAIGKLLTSAMTDRMQNAPKPVSVDWRALVNKKFGPLAKGDAVMRGVAPQTLHQRMRPTIEPIDTRAATVVAT